MGDDLLVTNPKRVQKAIDMKACNALLLKVNQIGSVTESIEAVKLSKVSWWSISNNRRQNECTKHKQLIQAPCQKCFPIPVAATSCRRSARLAGSELLQPSRLLTIACPTSSHNAFWCRTQPGE